MLDLTPNYNGGSAWFGKADIIAEKLKVSVGESDRSVEYLKRSEQKAK